MSRVSFTLPVPEAATEMLGQDTLIDDDVNHPSHTRESLLKQGAEQYAKFPAEKGSLLLPPAAQSIDDFNPMAWPDRKKTMALILIGMSTFLVPLATTAFLPAILTIEAEFNTSANVINVSVSTFILMIGAGPVILGPLSNLIGRRPIYMWGCLAYAVFAVGAALSPNVASLIVFRLLQAIAASPSTALSAASVADMYDISRRGSMMGAIMIGPLVAPAVAPALGGVIAQHLGWRAIFWMQVILGGIVFVLQFFLLPETFKPKKDPVTGKLPRYNPFSAIVVLANPAIVWSAAFGGIGFGLYYLVAVTIQITYYTQYAYNETQLGLALLGNAFGMLVGAIVGGRFSDWSRRKLIARYGPGVPEYRLYAIFPAVLLMPAGFLWYGWSVQEQANSVVPLVGLFFSGVAVMIVSVACSAYGIDSMTWRASDVSSGANLLRMSFAAITPQFAPQMYTALGNGWMFTVAVGFFLLCCCSVPFFIKYGHKYRPKPPAGWGQVPSAKTEQAVEAIKIEEEYEMP
ncbi:hypothetical protein SmJEL517_g00572 [Synchytrium microbalum]|uniref:Major facilitator superfamily (MFS) profile domain-containing protein n=1 Tax=Synchytrium microbalum TaxID=1806994 RepID=A0A507C9C3_9FUNG|nr:uncharacterized protein SmJEL517_g00572 [Synchytrium microbalum]TPX37667.1 hypothetical protein SmJEL517_g00572 [Synchytrium microbalum]